MSLLTRLVESKVLSDQNHSAINQFIWNNWVPLKVNFCVWRASLNCLPTRVILLNRGIPLDLIWCCFCGICPETLEHCLYSCSKVQWIWFKVFSWWHVSFTELLSLKDIMAGNIVDSRGRDVNKCFLGVCYIAIWLIWNWRNRLRVALENDVPSIINEDLFSYVQRMSLLWLSSRGNLGNVCWNKWITDPG